MLLYNPIYEKKHLRILKDFKRPWETTQYRNL